MTAQALYEYLDELIDNDVDLKNLEVTCKGQEVTDVDSNSMELMLS